MQLKACIFFVGIACMFGFNRAPESFAFEYIEQYRDLAVVEMYRSGVPASITLAQGLHESNYGTSRLAKEANNHFGIKCKSYWQGFTFFHKDDDFDKNGNLLESCFRAYGSALESFVDHSNFLKQTPHYAPLFQIERTDYVKWAHGLKTCGYATDAMYAEKLIRKIEKYNLHQYDHWESPFRTVLKK